ncbi:UNKNOWN [Stylonychia lemnae]|uniref:Uncharacterized protein n=1 Tax=Stylonychia lemnae TaxID=5949 RepID=A0A077ZW03_STYLE|nr:UNKNOWN [Stylonychia lemnae]|eukprot:CDW72621.1 UNKNOWN [Stylonychia lemnae]
MQRSIINSPNAENRLKNYLNPPTLQEIDEQSSQNDFKNFRANFQGVNTQNFQGRGMFTPTNNHPMNSNFDSSQLSPQNIDQRGKNTHRKRMVELNSPSQNQIHAQPYTRKASQLTLESNRSGTTQGGGQQSFLNVNMNQQSIFNNNNSINVQSYNIASIDQIVETIYDSLDKLKSYLMISIKDQESRLSKEYEEKFDKIHQRLLELEKNQSIAGNAQQNVISPLKSSMRSFDHMLNDRGIVQQHSDVKIHSNKFVYPSMITVKSGQTELSQLRGMQNTTHQTTNASCSAITNAKKSQKSPDQKSSSYYNIKKNQPKVGERYLKSIQRKQYLKQNQHLSKFTLDCRDPQMNSTNNQIPVDSRMRQNVFSPNKPPQQLKISDYQLDACKKIEESEKDQRQLHQVSRKSLDKHDISKTSLNLTMDKSRRITNMSSKDRKSIGSQNNNDSRNLQSSKHYQSVENVDMQNQLQVLASSLSQEVLQQSEIYLTNITGRLNNRISPANMDNLLPVSIQPKSKFQLETNAFQQPLKTIVSRIGPSPMPNVSEYNCNSPIQSKQLPGNDSTVINKPEYSEFMESNNTSRILTSLEQKRQSQETYRNKKLSTGLEILRDKYLNTNLKSPSEVSNGDHQQKQNPRHIKNISSNYLTAQEQISANEQNSNNNKIILDNKNIIDQFENYFASSQEQLCEAVEMASSQHTQSHAINQQNQIKNFLKDLQHENEEVSQSFQTPEGEQKQRRKQNILQAYIDADLDSEIYNSNQNESHTLSIQAINIELDNVSEAQQSNIDDYGI